MSTKRISLHNEVKTQLLELLQTMDEGEQIPTEFELADRFGVCRNTVREAIRVLEEESYLQKRRGIGTFVVRPPAKIQGNLQGSPDIFVMIRSAGQEPKIITEEMYSGALFDARYMSHKMLCPVVYRAYAANGTPVVTNESYFLTPLVTEADLRRKIRGEIRLATFLGDEYGIRLDRSVMHFYSVLPPRRVCEDLRISNSKPVLRLVKWFFSGDVPVLCAHFHLETDKFDLTLAGA